jgi:hypothetical protein
LIEFDRKMFACGLADRFSQLGLKFGDCHYG